ncbi:MAG: DUF4340 domain-containing protein [Myxococcota bacterium]|nr:DUF4340 domain-containing protein [Myxococcota bacterium]
MKLTSKSRVLLGIGLALGLLTAVPKSSDPSLSPLPRLEEVDPDQAARIEISRGPFEKVILKKTGESWNIESPFTAEADPILVKNLLREFKSPVPMDARVDDGNLETYGLQNETRILLEIFGATESPLLSFDLGGTTRGGASFIRLANSDSVYRARVGPRHRIDIDASQWRNKMVVSLDPEDVIAMRLLHGSSDLLFERPSTGDIGSDGNTTYGPWQSAGIDLDATTTKNLSKSLSKIRASEILSEGFDGGFDPPAATVELQTREGSPLKLIFGTRTGDGGVFVRRDNSTLTYRIAQSRLNLVTRPPEAYQNLQVVSFEPSTAIDMTWEDQGLKRTLTRQPDGVWMVTEPTKVDSDLKRILGGLTTVKSLRAQALVEDRSTPLAPPLEQLTIRFQDGTSQTLVASQAQQIPNRPPIRHIETSASERRYVVPETSWGRIRAAFGRGS